MKTILNVLVLFTFSAIGLSQTVLLEENFQNGIPNSWTTIDLDGQVPDSSVSFINEAWVSYETAFDTCAISTSYYTGTSNQAQDFLISPKVDLLDFGHILSWESKSFDANYLESYYVLLSTTDSLAGSFTDTLKFVSEDSPNWKTFTVNLFNDGFANQPVYIAFQNASTNEFVLGVDNVKLTTNDVAKVDEAPESIVTIFPNPVATQINISAPDGGAYRLVDLQGQLVQEGQLESGYINVQDIKPSVYILKVQVGHSVYTQKLIKK